METAIVASEPVQICKRESSLQREGVYGLVVGWPGSLQFRYCGFGVDRFLGHARQKTKKETFVVWFLRENVEFFLGRRLCQLGNGAVVLFRAVGVHDQEPVRVGSPAQTMAMMETNCFCQHGFEAAAGQHNAVQMDVATLF